MQSLQIRGAIVGVLFGIGCSTESARAPAAAPPGTTTTGPLAATTTSIVSATTPQAQPDTAPLAPLDLVTPATPDTTRCATPDTTRKNDAVISVDSEELMALKTANGKASRECGELRIRLLNGRTAILADNRTDGLAFALPRYAGYLKAIHSHAVHVHQYEGEGIYFVVDDSTGDSTFAFGMPAISPDAKRFAITSIAGMEGGNPGVIEVWRMVGRKPEKEFSYDTEESNWEASDPVWVDSTTIDFTKNSGNNPSEPYIENPGRLVKQGATWVLVPAPAVTANPVGVWRGTSTCKLRASTCSEATVVYRVARVNASDSLSLDARKIVNGRDEEIGVAGCRIVSGTQFWCPMADHGWYFTVRRDSLIGDLRGPDQSPYRDVRATRSR